MSTTALVDRLVPFARGWARTGSSSILNLIEQAQDKMMDVVAPYTLYVDPTDNKGFPPYLITTDSTFSYDVTAANMSVDSLTRTIGGTAYTVRCKRVIRVFVDVSTNDYNKKFVSDPMLYYYPNPYSVSTDRVAIATVPVDLHPRLANTDAKVVFKENPEATETQYFCEFIWEPPRLTAETVPLVVPEDYEEVIEAYVLGRIQWFSNGKPNEFLASWREGKTAFQQSLNAGSQSDNYETVLRPC